MKGWYVITNNPLVRDKLSGDVQVVYQAVSYEGLLREVRDRVHKGNTLLSHPLSGSVKPRETPYKSVIMMDRKGAVDEQSLALIENAMQACLKFEQKAGRFRPEVDKDFQLIDWTLLESAISSIDR